MKDLDRPSREAIAFAFVADAFTKTNDALRGLAPIFESAIAKKAGTLFDAASIASEVNVQFDLDVSPLVVEGLVPAFVQEGLLQKVAGTTEQVLYRCASKELSTYNKQTAEKVEAIFKEFRSFAVGLLAPHSFQFKDDELDQKLLDVISTTDFLYLALRNDQSRYKGRTLALRKSETVDMTDASKKALDAVAAQFVSRCMETDPQAFELLVNAAWGALIAEVILSLQHPEQQDISKLTVFLDGPLILDFLDIGSKEGHAYAKDLFDLLHKSGAKLATFGHVLGEMIGAISTPLERMAINEPVSGPLVRRLQSDPGHLTYVRAIISTLPSKLAAEGIEVLDDSKFETADLVSFFGDDEISSLRNAIGDPHFNLDRRDRDAKSVAYVTRLRRGIAARSVSEASAVFVTRNVGLAREAERQLQRTRRAPAFAAPVCVTDRQLAGVLWFCCGGGGQALTRLKLVANCAQAVVPRTDLVTQVAQILFDTNPNRLPEFEALLRDKRASMCLMRETVGVASFATAENAEKLLNDMRAELTADAQATFAMNLKEALAAQEAQHRKDIENERVRSKFQLEEQERKSLLLEVKLEEAVENHKESARKSAEDVLLLNHELRQTRNLLTETIRKMESEGEHREVRETGRRIRVRSFAVFIAATIEVAAAVLLSVGVLYGVYAAIKGASLAEFGWSAVVAYALATVILAIIGWFGWTRMNFRRFIAAWIERRLLSFFS